MALSLAHLSEYTSGNEQYYEKNPIYKGEFASFDKANKLYTQNAFWCLPIIFVLWFEVNGGAENFKETS